MADLMPRSGIARPTSSDPELLARERAAEEDRGSVARQLRLERRRLGLTLREVAARVSISTARLSAIEQNKQGLDVNLLVALSQSLGVTLDRLLPQVRADHLCVLRRAEADVRQHQPMKLVSRVTGATSGYHNRLRPLAGSFVGKHMEPLDIEIHPVPDDRLQFISHHHEEFFFVLQGEVECLLKTPEGLRREKLAPGDCMYFWSYLPHCIRSTSATPARSLHVLFSRDDAADSELFSNDTGVIFLLDAVHKSLSDRIAAQMVALRRARAMSISEFARALGTSPRRLSGIEKGQKPVSVQFLLEVCHRCGKPVEHFFPGSVAPRPYSAIWRSRDLRRHGGPPDVIDRTPTPPCVTAASLLTLMSGMAGQGMVPTLVKLRDGNGSPRITRHSGQEFIFVLKGTVKLTTMDRDRLRVETLAPGDACFIDATCPHAFEQARLSPYEQGPAEAIIVSCQPGWDGIENSQSMIDKGTKMNG